MNWFTLKASFVEQLKGIYSSSEATNILQILAEESFPIYSKIDFKQADFQMSNAEVHLLEKAMKRLLRKEPLQYILEKAWFYDLELKVNKNVLIPRPETEELVAWIIEDTPSLSPSIIDIGSGSGCIILSLKKHLNRSKALGIDVDPNVIQLAQENARNLGLEVALQVADILDKTEWKRLGFHDIIVSNPPYIPLEEKDKMEDNVLLHEPHLALFVEDEDEFIFYETIAEFAQNQLKPGGLLFFECNEFNAQELKEMLKNMGYSKVQIRKDLQGKERMIKAVYL